MLQIILKIGHGSEIRAVSDSVNLFGLTGTRTVKSHKQVCQPRAYDGQNFPPYRHV